jgi:hypothetical protein
MILEEFGPRTVAVQVKKFILPESRYVAVAVTRGTQTQSGHETD